MVPSPALSEYQRLAQSLTERWMRQLSSIGVELTITITMDQPERISGHGGDFRLIKLTPHTVVMTSSYPRSRPVSYTLDKPQAILAILKYASRFEEEVVDAQQSYHRKEQQLLKELEQYRSEATRLINDITTPF